VDMSVQENRVGYVVIEAADYRTKAAKEERDDAAFLKKLVPV